MYKLRTTNRHGDKFARFISNRIQICVRDTLFIEIFRIAVLLVVTFAYAMLDLFNNRNLPNYFAYSTVVAGLLLTLTYPYPTMLYSLAIAAVIAAIGYITYRMGLLGGGDVFEFVFISLVMPTQMIPLLIRGIQFNLPFILSVFITAGYTTVLVTPVYYILKGKRKLGHKNIKVDPERLVAGCLIFIMYAALIIFTTYEINYNIVGILLLFGAAIPSVIILIYEKYIYEGMMLMVYPSKLEEGDMIATNRMHKKEIEYFKSRSRNFGRLVTKPLMNDISKVKRQLPVYKNAIPMALFTFIGVVVSLLVGNLILLIFF